MDKTVEVWEKTRLHPKKFADPLATADGNQRAFVNLQRLDTLWFNTGSLCNITCANCYIESSPTNDRLVYLSADEVKSYLDEINALGWDVKEIGFTGGEPFMNPDFGDMLAECLARGFQVLVLTNAMQPMLRPHVKTRLLDLNAQYGERLVLRVSLDHYGRALHEQERGAGTWEKALEGLRWLSQNGFTLNIAGRTISGEPEASEREGYARLFAKEKLNIDADDPVQLVLFPEMNETVDVPEITVDCWDILNVSPAAVMCSNSRMVVKRKGEAQPVVLPCTLLPYDRQFELGHTLTDAAKTVHLNHPHCAKFCVLGGASCSVGD